MLMTNIMLNGTSLAEFDRIKTQLQDHGFGNSQVFSWFRGCTFQAKYFHHMDLGIFKVFSWLFCY